MEWLTGALVMTGTILKVVVGFSFIVFIHELGHFLAAKANGVRVDRFAVGFGPRLFGWRRGEGLTIGRRPEYKPEELRERRFGETDYCLNLLPLGGYVKMLGQDDIVIDEKTNDMRIGDDPRAFPNRPVWRRMIVVSAGVVANVILAAILLIGVFLIGRSDSPPIVATVPPVSDAYGKLKAGDRIHSIDGWRTDSLYDVLASVAFSEGPVSVMVKRDGALLEAPLTITPRFEPNIRIKMLDVEMAQSLRIARDSPEWLGAPRVKKGDTVVSAAGQPIRSPRDFQIMFARSQGREVEFEVARPDDSAPGGSRTLQFRARPSLVLLGRLDGREGAREEGSLLGLMPRPRVAEVFDRQPAAVAGIRPGDTVLAVGSVHSPVYSEILGQIKPSGGKLVTIRVLRDGSEHSIQVTPRAGTTLGKPDAKLGARFHHFGEIAPPVVARVLPGSPADSLGLPRGALLVAIDGEPVADWFDVWERLVAAAGREVRVRYTHGGNEGAGVMRVPDSFARELGLTPESGIASIDGRFEFSLDLPGGRATRHVNDASALPMIMKQFIGRTVKIRFARTDASEIEERDVAITQENYDPWQLRAMLLPDPERFAFDPLKETIRAGGVVEAASMSGREVVKWVYMTYITLHQFLIKRNVGAEHMSGPIGMAQVAVERARMGLSELLYFLAFISVNLAVLNFLPLPVLDGGLMVFLIIEALKGKPLNLRTQMVATLVGLAAIICIGLFVTFQDILKLL